MTMEISKMNISFSPPDITEVEIHEVIDTLKSGWITTGPKTKLFEKRLALYCGTNKTVCLNSATAALEMTLRLLGIGPGDEVIVPSYTYTASCSPICHVGATPVMIDTLKNSFVLDYTAIAEKINEKTKAIITVDIAGVLCDYERVFEEVNKKKDVFAPANDLQKVFERIIVIADSAHGIGAEAKGLQSGRWADFTTFSFHAVKNLTTAEGGAVTWNVRKGLDDEWIYKQYQLLSLHGQSKDALNKMKPGAWEYDVLFPAYKCNMTDIQASIGLAQLKRYDNILRKRHRIIVKYKECLRADKVLVPSHSGDDYISSGHLYMIRIAGIGECERNEIIMKMAEKGIACNVHYKPLPLLSAYKQLGFSMDNYPNAYKMYCNEITLPLYNELHDEQVDYIINELNAILEDY